MKIQLLGFCVFFDPSAKVLCLPYTNKIILNSYVLHPLKMYQLCLMRLWEKDKPVRYLESPQICCRPCFERK